MAHGEDILRPGERLEAGQYLRSKNGWFHAVMQEDSNFVVYRGDQWEHAEINPHLWSYVVNELGGKLIADEPCFAIMQTDNNFVVYKKSGGAIWSSKTGALESNPGVSAELQNDGNFVILGGQRNFRTNMTDKIKEETTRMVSIDYDMTRVRVTEAGEPGRSLGNSAVNKTSINQSATISLSYTKSTSHTFDFTLGFKLSGTVKGKVGVPFVAEGEVSVTAEASTAFRWSDTETIIETETVQLPVVVPPGKKIIARCVWHTSKIDVPFKLRYTAEFEHFDDALPLHSDGVYRGINTHDIEVSWVEVDPHKAQPLNWIRADVDALLGKRG